MGCKHKAKGLKSKAKTSQMLIIFGALSPPL